MKTARALGIGVCLLLILGAAPAANAAQQMGSTLDDCLSTAGGSDHGCYEIALGPETDGTARVVLSWDLLASGDGITNANWQGGVWMQRWPVKGQWKKYPKGGETFPAGTTSDNCASPFSATNCARTFSGPKGSLTLEFPASMAGYVYEIVSHDTICTDDGSVCSPSGGIVGANSTPQYVFVLKAWRYKNIKGKTVVTASCPPANKRASKCTPAARGVLANGIGGEVPVSLP